MKTKWFCLIISLSLIANSFAHDELVEIRELLEKKTKFTPQQIESVLTLVESTNRDNLPVEILTSRIKEGIARKADFQTLLEVLNKKINSLKLAYSLIAENLNKGMSVKNYKYSYQLLAELLERGLSKDYFKSLSNLALLRNIRLDEIVRICEITVRHKEWQFPVEYSEEIISLAITKKLDQKAIEYLGEVIIEEIQNRNLSAEEIKDIVIEGINKRRSVMKIKEELRDAAGIEKIRDERYRRVQTGMKGEISDELKKKGIEEKEKRQDKRGR